MFSIINLLFKISSGGVGTFANLDALGAFIAWGEYICLLCRDRELDLDACDLDDVSSRSESPKLLSSAASSNGVVEASIFALFAALASSNTLLRLSCADRRLSQ